MLHKLTVLKMDQSEQEMSELTAAMQELHDQYKDLKERFKKTEAECVQFRVCIVFYRRKS